MYKLNMNIPGWNREEILNVIAKYASEVSENGHILEMGALFGRTSYVLGNNKKESVKLTVIDIWPTLLLDYFTDHPLHDNLGGHHEISMINALKKTEPNRIDSNDHYTLWKLFTAGMPNVTSIQASTDIDNADFPMYDLIIHDADHSYPQVYKDLKHWFPKLKENGVMIIDDYEPQFPGVIESVDQFVKENSLVSEMVTKRNILIRKGI